MEEKCQRHISAALYLYFFFIFPLIQFSSSKHMDVKIVLQIYICKKHILQYFCRYLSTIEYYVYNNQLN
jgi:hypothetical protein